MSTFISEEKPDDEYVTVSGVKVASTPASDESAERIAIEPPMSDDGGRRSDEPYHIITRAGSRLGNTPSNAR